MNINEEQNPAKLIKFNHKTTLLQIIWNYRQHLHYYLLWKERINTDEKGLPLYCH